MTALMIEAVDVDFEYRRPRRYREMIAHPLRRGRGRPVLQGVGMRLEPGVSAAFVGVNGAGKTTLLKLVGGMIHPSRGRISVAGLDTVADAPRLRKQAGYVINEDRSFHWRLTGRENLSFFAALNDCYGDGAAVRIDALLEQVGLSGSGDKRVGEYSSGMRQRLAIARGLLNDPEVLLLDEPTKSLDPEGAQTLRRCLADWAKGSDRKRTVIVATNDAEDVLAMCAVYFVVASGRVSGVKAVMDRALGTTHRWTAQAAVNGAAFWREHA